MMQPVQNTLFTIQAGQPKSAHDHKDHDGHQQAAVRQAAAGNGAGDHAGNAGQRTDEEEFPRFHRQKRANIGEHILGGAGQEKQQIQRPPRPLLILQKAIFVKGLGGNGLCPKQLHGGINEHAAQQNARR